MNKNIQKTRVFFIIALTLISLFPLITLPLAHASSYAYVNSYSDAYSPTWTKTGASPYLSAIDNPTNIISTSTNNRQIGNFGFPATSSVTAIEVYAKVSSTGSGSYFSVYQPGGVGSIGDITPTSTSYQWYSVASTSDATISLVYVAGSPARTITIDAARLVYTLAVAPTASGMTSNSTQPLGYCNVSAIWTANSGTMSKYTLGTNNTGPWTNQTTWTAFSGGSTRSSKIIVLNATVNHIGWRFYANNTVGGVGDTGIQVITVSNPTISQVNFGSSAGFTQQNTFYNGTATGGQANIYFAYQNSTYWGAGSTRWAYVVRAFDVYHYTWTPQVFISNSTNDGHYVPAISVLKDGNDSDIRIIYMYGYAGALNYTLSTHNPATTSNSTLLLEGWTSIYQLTFGSKGSVSYPQPYFFSDRLVIFGRSGTADSGNWAYQTYKIKTASHIFVPSNFFDATYNTWQNSGTNPYINNQTGTHFIFSHSTSQGGKEGYFKFSFDSGYCPTGKINSVFLNLSVAQVETGATVDVWVQTGYSESTLHKLGSLSTTGWHSFNVTNWLGSISNITNNRFMFNKTNSDYTMGLKIDLAKLELNYTGFDVPYSDFVVPVHGANGDNSIYANEYQVGDTILWAAVGFNTSQNKERNVYFAYSTDKAQTWKMANGTALSSPNILLSKTLVYSRSASARLRSQYPMIDEKNRPMVICVERNSSVGLNNQWKAFVLQYNTTKGTVGTWQYQKALDKQGNQLITGFPANYLDSYYNRPAFWDSGNSTNNYVALYVRNTDSNNTFIETNDDYTHKVFEMGGSFVVNSPQFYNVMTYEEWWDVLGRYTVGATKSAYLSASTMYACQFTANFTVRINAMSVYLNASYVWFQGALYSVSGTGMSRSFTLLASTAQVTTASQTPGTWTTWEPAFLTFSSEPQVTSGQSYIIALRTNSTNALNYYYDTSTSPVNRSFTYPATWASAFPSSITASQIKTSGAFLNRSISYDAFPIMLNVRGIGPPQGLITLSVNSTQGGSPTKVSSYWSDWKGLSGGKYATNNTGSWVTQAWTDPWAGNPSAAWFNFTISSLNSTRHKVSFWIAVNNTINSWWNTSTQIINVKLVLTNTQNVGFTWTITNSWRTTQKSTSHIAIMMSTLDKNQITAKNSQNVQVTLALQDRNALWTKSTIQQIQTLLATGTWTINMQDTSILKTQTLSATDLAALLAQNSGNIQLTFTSQNSLAGIMTSLSQNDWTWTIGAGMTSEEIKVLSNIQILSITFDGQEINILGMLNGQEITLKIQQQSPPTETELPVFPIVQANGGILSPIITNEIEAQFLYVPYTGITITGIITNTLSVSTSIQIKNKQNMPITGFLVATITRMNMSQIVMTKQNTNQLVSNKTLEFTIERNNQTIIPITMHMPRELGIFSDQYFFSIQITYDATKKTPIAQAYFKPQIDTWPFLLETAIYAVVAFLILYFFILPTLAWAFSKIEIKKTKKPKEEEY